jgi:hypothetical protein
MACGFACAQIRTFWKLKIPSNVNIASSVEEVDVCHLSKRVVFDLHHESNTSNHFNCSELSKSSDCLYGAVVCSRDTDYATHWIRVIAYPSVR